jgi:hypothetical protein
MTINNLGNASFTGIISLQPYQSVMWETSGITGNIQMYQGGGNALNIVNNYSGSYIYLTTSGGGGLTINGSGYLGINNGTPQQALDVNGNIIASGRITSGSDYRIKEDIKALDLDEYSVDNLKPVTFKFKKDNKESIGLIAHELQEHYPFLVEGEKDGEQTQTVNYNGLVGVLIKEIQELKKRVKTLENKIE